MYTTGFTGSITVTVDMYNKITLYIFSEIILSSHLRINYVQSASYLRRLWTLICICSGVVDGNVTRAACFRLLNIHRT